MKTIYEIARDYQRSDEDDGTTATAFQNGAEWMRKELTRWNDPKEVPSEPNHIVLTKWKHKDGSGEIIYVGGFNGEEWEAHAMMYPELFDIIGWREIHQ